MLASGMDLTSKTALVTGASKGIGLAVARALLGADMNVVLGARDQAALESAAAEAVAGSSSPAADRALAVGLDVRDPATVEAAVEAALSTFGSLDLVVANAGVGASVAIDEMDAETWHRVIDTNLTGVFNTVKASIPALKRSRGMIITIGSLAGANFFAGGAAYNASKFGLLGFTQAVMLDLRDHGVRVSTIMPGSVATGFNRRTVSAADAWKIAPEDIAETVLYLARMSPRTLPSKIEMRPARTRLD